MSEALAGIGALAEPVRRALYEYVVAQPDAVGREEAAGGADVPLHTAKFHLDRLVEEGLLDVEFRRLSGRTGPGAGRPSKLYRRSARELSVTLPPRRYDLVAHILAAAMEQAGRGTTLDEALEASARDEGATLATRAEPTEGPELDRLGQVLATQGYEPRVADDAMVLANCPFDALAQQHRQLICGLNQTFVQGVADALGCRTVEAGLEPGPGRCCVTARVRG